MLRLILPFCLLRVSNLVASADDVITTHCRPCQHECSETPAVQGEEISQQVQATLASINDRFAYLADELKGVKSILRGVERKIDEITPPEAYKPSYRVFHFKSPRGSYRLTLRGARKLCASKNMELATITQLEAAFRQGLNLCTCGWLDDGTARYAVQYPEDWCGGKVSEAGIRFCTWGSKWDAYCFNSKSLWGKEEIGEGGNQEKTGST